MEEEEEVFRHFSETIHPGVRIALMLRGVEMSSRFGTTLSSGKVVRFCETNPKDASLSGHLGESHSRDEAAHGGDLCGVEAEPVPQQAAAARRDHGAVNGGHGGNCRLSQSARGCNREGDT